MNTKHRVGSLDQFQIALFASKDKRLSACDLACLFEIVDRFLKDGGKTRPTGKAHLERETGRSNGSVKESLRRLVDWEYIRIAVVGRGTRGTEYVPNFDWAQRIAATIKAEISDRAAVKKKRRSGAEFRPTSEQNLVGRNFAPLRDLVRQPSAPLDPLVGQDSAPQTYVLPTREDYVGTYSPPPTARGLAAAPGGRDRDHVAKVTASEVQLEDGELWLNLTLELDDGAVEPYAICVESYDADTQKRGQARLEKLRTALGLEEIDEPKSVLGIPFVLLADDSFGAVATA